MHSLRRRFRCVEVCCIRIPQCLKYFPSKNHDLRPQGLQSYYFTDMRTTCRYFLMLSTHLMRSYVEILAPTPVFRPDVTQTGRNGCLSDKNAQTDNRQGLATERTCLIDDHRRTCS